MKKYILGLATGLIFIPIINELLNVIFAWIEYIKILPSKLILSGNKELSELQSDNDGQEEVSCMGFQYTSKNKYDND